MNGEQKRAWLCVGSGVVCLISYVVLAPIFGPWAATAVFGLFGLNGFALLIGRKEKPDERDISIAKRAAFGGFAMSYVAFVAGCMGVWFVAFAWHRQKMVPVDLFSTITGLAVFALFFTRAVIILTLYGRAVEADHV